MKGFSDLPNEIVVEVWRLIQDPRDVEAFAFTSKKIYALGDAAIAEHNELKAKFSSVPCRDDEISVDTVDVLKSLLLSPRAALYVQRISIDEWRDSPNDCLYSEDTIELLRQWFKDSPWIPKEDVEWWLEDFEIGRMGLVEFRVLLSLPNVYSFELYCMHSTYSSSVFESIKRISKLPDSKALSQLTKVRLIPGDYLVAGKLEWVFIPLRLIAIG